EQLIKSIYLIAGISLVDVQKLIEQVKKQIQFSGPKLAKVPSHREIVKALIFNIFNQLPMAQQPPRSFLQMKSIYSTSTLDLLGVDSVKRESTVLKSVKSIKSLIRYYLSLNKEIELWQHFFQHLANKISGSAFKGVSSASLQKLENLLQELQSNAENAVLLTGIRGNGQSSQGDADQQAKKRIEELVKTKLIPLAEYVHQIDWEIHKAQAFKSSSIQAGLSDFNDTDFISVSNAGLVLLWPFLARFFENLGLVEDQVFKDIPARQKAACMLQFICGQEETEIFEGQLPLAKVLCGIPMEEAVRITDISDSDKEIVDGLLKAIIRQVPQWKNMSVKGFVTSYLERPASLRIRDNHWLLQVQRETYDILLQKLPWGYHTVSLPWMDRVLVVEW
ncbi:MAG: contractile injection system tape measure protein, partial [Bacteroidota bacterium]